MSEDNIDQPLSVEELLDFKEETKPQVLYSGTIGYFFRHAGIEEGAHAVLWKVKKESKKGKGYVANAEKEVSQSEERPAPTRPTEIYFETPLTDTTDEQIQDLLELSNDQIPPFDGNVETATEYCRQFLDGVSIPMDKMRNRQFSDTKFALAIPKESDDVSRFYFLPDKNMICINRSFLSDISKRAPESTIEIVGKPDHNLTNHEQRALLWQIKDAREHKMSYLVGVLKGQLNWNR